MSRTWHLIAYDVADPKRLCRTATVLEGHGQRLQFSVFRCRLSERQLERLRWELAHVMNAEKDSLLVIPLCGACSARAAEINVPKTWPEEPERFEIL